MSNSGNAHRRRPLRGFTRELTRCGLVLAALAVLSGCVGPMRLSRALDESYNEFYVKSPLLTAGAGPFIVAGDVLAKGADYLLLNPFLWWRDVMRGRGTAYNYRNPAPPEER